MYGVNNNIGNYRAQDAFALNSSRLQVSLERLSTGVRVNRAEDDAAGIIVRDRFQAQIGGFEEAIRNIQTAQGMVQMAEEGLNKVTDALQQMRQLAVRAADDNLTDHDRQDVQQQVKALLKEVNDRADKTRYNGRKLLDGSITEAVDEKRAEASVQSNAHLRDGSKLMDIELAKSTNATTFGAVSQGSYEVKLVYSDEQRAGATGSTTLEGALNTTGGANQGTISQLVYDKDGNAHAASFTLIQGAGHDWSYVVNIEGGGSFKDAVTASGTMVFKDVAAGDLDPMDTGKMVANTLTLDSYTGALTPGNLTYVDLSKGSITLAINDGTATGQSYTVDFSKLAENEMDPAAITTMPALADPLGSQGSQTSRVAVVVDLDSNDAIGATFDSAGNTAWFDRTGVEHDTDFRMTKIATGDGINTGDTWKYTLLDFATGDPIGESGVLTGNNENATDIILQFDVAGNIQSVNGAAGSSVTVKLGDGTASGQQVLLDFATSTATAGGADTVAQTPVDGAAGTPTAEINFFAIDGGNAPRLISGAGPMTFKLPAFIDRTGTNSVEGMSITFTQVGTSNSWDYEITSPADSGMTGKVLSGGTGQIEFQDDGDLITYDPTKPVKFDVKFDDGTAEGQTVTLKLEDPLDLVNANTGLKMASATDLRATKSDGGIGSGDPQVDAVIYWTDGGDAPTIVSTLEGVSVGAKTYESGGVKLTVNTVSKHDAGLVAFAKTLTYVSATTQDNALQFQTGSDEGEVFRVGIEKMTVDKLFRMDYYKGEDTEDSISLGTTLQAQDMIGQIDDALRVVGRANVKVGAFKNEFDRTLELQRSNHTQMLNAFALVNDADMAMEATNQSKRMVLIQSSTAMVAQANTTSQFVLQLLR